MLRVRSVVTGVAGSPAYINHYFVSTDDATGAQDAIDAVDLFWQGLDGLMDNACTITIEGEVPIINVASGDITGVVSATGSTQTGDSPASLLPPATQGLIRWSTNTFVGGRRLIGRTFCPYFTVDNLESDGTPTSGSLSGMGAAALALISAGAGFSIYSRTHATAAEVNEYVIPNEFAVLRSRRD